MRIHLISLFIFMMTFVHHSYALRKAVLSPYQMSIQSCLGKDLDIKKISSHKSLYKNIEQQYMLLTSETLYREVFYSLKNELKKLKYSDGLIKIYKVLDEDDVISLISTEKFDEKKQDYQLRHKIRSVEERINQLLFRADIKSDFQKIKETRVKQLVLNIAWADKQIKSLNIESLSDKKTLNCTQKELIDVCNCQKNN